MDRGGKFTLTYEVAASRAVSDSTPITVRATLTVGVLGHQRNSRPRTGHDLCITEAPGDVRPYPCSLRDSAVIPTAGHLQNTLPLVPAIPGGEPCPTLAVRRPIPAPPGPFPTSHECGACPQHVHKDLHRHRAPQSPRFRKRGPSIEPGHCGEREGLSRSLDEILPLSTTTTPSWPRSCPAGPSMAGPRFRPSSTSPTPTAPCHPQRPQRQRSSGDGPRYSALPTRTVRAHLLVFA